jgi:hypothetical protein
VYATDPHANKCCVSCIPNQWLLQTIEWCLMGVPFEGVWGWRGPGRLQSEVNGRWKRVVGGIATY